MNIGSIGQVSSQDFIDSLGVIILGLDPLGEISLVNIRGAQLLGEDSAALIGTDFFASFLHPRDRQEHQDIYLRTMAGDKIQDTAGKFRIVSRAGRTHMIRWQQSVLKNESGQITGIVYTGEDISGRLEAEEIQKKQELRFHRFVDHAVDAFFVHDQQGRFIDVNHQACTSLGYSREQLLSMEVGDVNPSFSDVPVAASLGQILHVDAPTLLQSTHRHRDGHRFPVEVSLECISDEEPHLFISVARDISERLQQEKNLEESRELLHIITDATPDIICVKDGQGRYLLANDFHLSLFGLEDVVYLGRTDAELASFSPRYKEALLGCMDTDEAAWKAAVPCRVDENIPRQDGSEGVFDVYKIPLFHRDCSRKALVVSGRDITKQKGVEVQLSQAAREWEQTFDAIPDIITIQDLDMRIIRANKAGRELRGDTLAVPITGHFCHESLFQSKTPCVGCPVSMTAQDGRPHSATVDYQGLESRYQVSATPVFNEKGKLTQIVHVARDVTRRIEEEEERLRLMAIIDQVTESIVVTDADALIEYVNPAFEQVTGYSLDDVRGQNPSLLQGGQSDPVFYQNMWENLKQKGSWRGHLVNRSKKGILFEEDASISPIRNREGVVTNYVAVKRDTTREVDLQKQLNQAMKMEAIGTLAGGIAHDFNNILTAILGYAEMVNFQIREEDPVKQDVGQIIAAANRAGDLVKQILTFSRQEEERLRPLKPQLVIQEALKLLRSSLPATIELLQEIDDDCGTVLADPTLIHQVLINLCTNAKQAMGEEGGQLRVVLQALKIPPEEGPICLHPAIERGQWLDLEVSDSGPGMHPTIREKIFDPFFTTKEKGQGTGLGLSVVHGIVKSHGGEVTITSSMGKGSSFHVYLPLIEEEETVQPLTVPDALPRGNERILFVDDEVILVELMGKILRTLGYTVIGKTQSSKALHYFQEHPDEIDLLITDMTMPGMTGMELAAEVLAMRPQLPVILCTGHSEYIGEEQALEQGVGAFLSKPLQNRMLAQTVRRLLDKL